MKLLNLESISAGYASRGVLENITLGVESGEFLGILGPNGAGKTTLFRVISGILKPSSGKALFEGRDVSGIPKIELARNVAAVQQMLNIPFSFTVEEFVMMGRFPHTGRFKRFSAEDFRITVEVLATTETEHLKHRFLNELSSGERQRVFLAQALAQKPKLLLLDEPTTHLDISHQAEIMGLLRKLNTENGLTIIAIMHDLNLSGEYFKKLVLLDSGMIYASGLPSEVLTYQNIEKVYKTVVIVKENPLSGKPYVFPVSGEKRGGESRNNAG